MGKRLIFLDIETIPGQQEYVMQVLLDEANDRINKIQAPSNYKDATKIEEFCRQKREEILEDIDSKYRRTSFDGALGQIVAASMAVDDELPVQFFHEEWRDSEAKILDDLFAEINAVCATPGDYQVFVGHNVVAFDMRFLFHRAVLLGIKPPDVIPFAARPWDTSKIYDTMVSWAGVGGRISLDKLCRVMGIPGKGSEIGDEIDGSKVWDFVMAGRVRDVAEYCAGDVERVRQVYKRLTWGAR